MRAIAVDASLACCGVAWGPAGRSPCLSAVPMPEAGAGGSLLRASRALHDALDAAMEFMRGVDVVAIEQPPPTFRSDNQGRSARQAVIGFGLGRAVGLVEGWAYRLGLDVELVENAAWRAWARRMSRTLPGLPPPPLVLATALRPTTALPPEAAEPRGWRLRWSGCDHALIVWDVASLQRRPERCPTCEATSAPRPEPSPAERELAHKRPWVELASQRWPDAVSDVAAEARRRLRTHRDRPDYAVPGVADACDAALLWGMVQARDPAVTGSQGPSRRRGRGCT